MPLQTLLEFSRLSARATSIAEVLELLARSAVDPLGADGSAVVQVENGGARVVAAQNAEETLGMRLEAELLGPEAGARLASACKGRFQQSLAMPLVAGGDLFGMLVLLFGSARQMTAEQIKLAGAMADLAASSLERASHIEKLERAVSELEASQQALTRADKLRALGEMAAGVAHDLINIFNPLKLNVSMLGLGRPVTPERLETLNRIIDRGLDTVQRLRAFSRQTPEQQGERVDLNALVREVAELSQPRLHKSHDQTLDLQLELGNPPPVRLPPSELVAVLTNLVVNACDAIPGNGTITLRTQGNDSSACIEVSDTGTGMPEEVQRRIFEPFFTTKGEKGTGLGLAMAHAFVQRQGGTISVESTVGTGTTFLLRFPAAADEANPR